MNLIWERSIYTAGHLSSDYSGGCQPFGECAESFIFNIKYEKVTTENPTIFLGAILKFGHWHRNDFNFRRGIGFSLFYQNSSADMAQSTASGNKFF